MTYGQSKDKQGRDIFVLEMSAEEHARFEKGLPILKHTNKGDTNYEIRVKMKPLIEEEKAKADVFRKIAKDHIHRDGEIEIDEDAEVSLIDEGNGAYVEAWIWIDAPKENTDGSTNHPK